jgi:phenylalanyl-tRNA synthetase alpha chain
MAAEELISKLNTLGNEFGEALVPLKSEQEIREIQARFLGKKGRVSALMREMGKLPPEDKRSVGAAFNRVKNDIAGAVDGKLGELSAAKEAADLARSVDVSLPGRTRRIGHTHLLTQVRDEAVAIFGELGFEVAEGPQIETDFHNFEALGFAKDHPARDEQDTFFVDDGKLLLRTHTSPVQIRTMLASEPPIKIVAPGAVYRRDDDPTHSPMFGQIEGLLVDEHVRFSDLKGVLLHFVKRYFGEELEIRFRPSFFPFVEPGAEVDMQCSFCLGGDASSCRVCKGTTWVEIAGAGMVDPVVLEHVKIDTERYTGFAFGMGLERMAMLRYGVNDIKNFYEGDMRFLTQF